MFPFYLGEWNREMAWNGLTLFPLRYLGPLYHFGGEGRGEVLVLEVLVQFTSNLVSILPTISTSKKNQNGTLGHVIFWWCHHFSRNLVKFWWNHHRRNHYSYDVIRVTRPSTNLNLYYFIIKCNHFIKILQRGKITKNMKFVQNFKFPKNFQVLLTK